VNEIASMWLAQLSNVYSGKGNSVNIQHRDTLLVRAPESVLSIVLGNLLGNAFSYTAYGAIKVFVDSNSIRITDTGVGMEQSSVDNAFEPFYRANIRNGSDEHQGLGLAIVKQSCTYYGWEVRLESELGKGTSVTIIF